MRQWQAKGWAGHTAICLSVGYVWLALGAALGLAGQIVFALMPWWRVTRGASGADPTS